MVWKYKIELKDEKVFDEIEKERGITLPRSFKKLIKEANGGTPEKYTYVVGQSERIIGAILSFNKDEIDTDTVYTALKSIDDKNLMPFAIDPFGNYTCLAIKDNVVVFWDHENGQAYSTEKSLDVFLNDLY